MVDVEVPWPFFWGQTMTHSSAQLLFMWYVRLTGCCNLHNGDEEPGKCLLPNHHGFYMQFPKMSVCHPHLRSTTPTNSYFEDGLKPEPTRFASFSWRIGTPKKIQKAAVEDGQDATRQNHIPLILNTTKHSPYTMHSLVVFNTNREWDCQLSNYLYWPQESTRSRCY